MQVSSESRHTPLHAPGFMDRLDVSFSEAGIRPREYVSLIIKATGLSKSGARLVIESQRPPKRLDAFDRLVLSLRGLLIEKNIDVKETVLAEFLLYGKINPFIKQVDEFSISTFLEKDAILTSEVIIKVENLAKANFSTTVFSEESKRLIYFRILSYTFKNNIASESEVIEKHILGLLSLAKEHLI